ncbi:glycosyltransferase family A protein [Bacterioplanoides sp. SCSIO 12839]|uniref:glycosyltransferase family A protein n=1 Tax=Bacterioplanoides sp. SCSIO 12839 TaxID=2829569 RepID=UPI0021032D39|nr:glycosyltransferase family A protein [Bacterioplanoides sp. SCSIO 12839]UTW46886.1 glycosyltransferase family 2 protein [Bacterioplanoides sp. SCSIO 12839]
MNLNLPSGEKRAAQFKSQCCVSVVIPTYNCLEYLPRAIRSILDQGIHNLEILVIDDNSSDGTWAWLQEQQKRIPQLRSYHLRGVGSARARNFALKRVRGEYIAFLDADDYWHSGKLKKQLDFHRSDPRIVMSFTNYHHTTPDNTDLGDCFGFWPHFKQVAIQDNNFHELESAAEKIFSENVIGTSCVMVKTKTQKMIGGFDNKLKSAEDWDLWMRFCKAGRVAYCNEELMEYLVRPGSKTSNRLRRLDHMKIIMKRHEGYVKRLNIWAVMQAYGRLATGYAEHYAEQQQFLKAFWHQTKATLLNPSKRNAKAALAQLYWAIKSKKQIA